MKIAILSSVLLCLASPALANLEVRFDEDAPKDRFTLTNTGTCSLGTSTVTIDLAGSPYGLIFDVTSIGAGVEVFQPFELTRGADILRQEPVVSDGDNRLTLDIANWPAGATLSFTIDVDDTANAREITVSDTEIVGAQILASTMNYRAKADFQNNAMATVPLTDCTS